MSADSRRMKKALEIAAQCWCDPETSSIEMDVLLAQAFAKRIAILLEKCARLRASALALKERP